MNYSFRGAVFPSKTKSSLTGIPSWAEKTSRFSKDGALIPRSITLRKSTEISSSSANFSWLILLASRIALRRLPNFSRRADKCCTCGPNVAHARVSNHRMRLRVVMRLRVGDSHLGSGSTLAGCLLPAFAKETQNAPLKLSPPAGRSS
jgi:hypothetical protein